MTDKLNAIRQSDGTLPTYAWPGGYPIVYLDKYGEPYTADEANDPDYADDIVGYFIHWEGPPIVTSGGDVIESAYGDPDNPESD